ncbi:peptide synthase [Gordonia sp. HNM0687]|uniref:Peptide synthase n=1 Tax=Gordonia mangrovi TaxID=2665643 RepID=A0A6L7GUF0_9ACTN|nr:condensation domain-containing protein [Gordonia mangrovi]MXP23132.1 peptide synthase [Gordonia mangrovi]UVF77414.1 condensation domain-containing protein [Gordonia mangrovi]
MEYTELADYPLPGGSMSAWIPRADPDAWTEDPRRLSYMHVEHALRAGAEGDDWYSQWIGTAFLIERPLDRDSMAQTMTRWYARHEAFRTSVTAADRQLKRHTLPAQSVTVDEQPMGTDLSSTEVFERMNEYFNTTVSPLRWPHCIAVTVEITDRDDAFLLVFAADHTVMDAYTQVFAIKELTAIYESVVTGEPDGLVDFGSYVDFSDAERALGDQICHTDDAVAGWSTFFGAADELSPQPAPMPTFPLMSASPHGDPPSIVSERSPEQGFQATLSSWLLDTSQTAAFNALCKESGANMQAGIYTALSMTSAALSGSADLRFLNPIHTRNEMKWGEAAGWFVGIIPVHLRPQGARTFRGALTAIAASSQEYKQVGAAPFAPIADLIGGDTTPPGFVVSYIDLRHAEGAADWDRRRARVLRSSTRNADEVYFWINRVPAGTNISARFPTGARADEVHRFISTFHRILTTVIAEGDLAYAFADSAKAV